MLSFWEKNSLLNYDFIVVGGGIVGLSTAATLAEKAPKSKILVLERGLFPTGASTKNAGFACFGSLTEILADLQTMSSDEVLNLVEKRWQGLQKLRTRLTDKSIGFEANGGYELITEKELSAVQELDKINMILKDIFKKNVFELQNEHLKNFGFSQNHIKSLVFNAFEGQIDTGQMMRSLWLYVQQKGVVLLTNAEISHFEDDTKDVKVYLKNQEAVFKASKIVLATNAFTNNLIPELEISAGRGQVLITSPIENLPFKGVFHLDEGYFYFRNYGNRVLFGGGRNLDFEGETTTKFELNDLIMNDLEKKLREIILPNRSYQITDRWAGIMAFGKTKSPIFKFHSENVLLAVRMGGMGVAIGSEIGQQAAEKLLGQN